MKPENNNSEELIKEPDRGKKSVIEHAGINNVSLTVTPEQSPLKILQNGGIEEPENRKTRRWPTDKAYFIAKELLMTERTYKKDLDVINVVSVFLKKLNNCISSL